MQAVADALFFDIEVGLHERKFFPERNEIGVGLQGAPHEAAEIDAGGFGTLWGDAAELRDGVQGVEQKVGMDAGAQGGQLRFGGERMSVLRFPSSAFGFQALLFAVGAHLGIADDEQQEGHAEAVVGHAEDRGRLQWAGIEGADEQEMQGQARGLGGGSGEEAAGEALRNGVYPAEETRQCGAEKDGDGAADRLLGCLDGDPDGDYGGRDQADRQPTDHRGEGDGEGVGGIDHGSVLKQRFAQSHQSQRDSQAECLRRGEALLKQEAQHPPAREQVGDDYQYAGVPNEKDEVGGLWLHRLLYYNSRLIGEVDA